MVGGAMGVVGSDGRMGLLCQFDHESLRPRFLADSARSESALAETAGLRPCDSNEMTVAQEIASQAQLRTQTAGAPILVAACGLFAVYGFLAGGQAAEHALRPKGPLSPYLAGAIPPVVVLVGWASGAIYRGPSFGLSTRGGLFGLTCTAAGGAAGAALIYFLSPSH